MRIGSRLILPDADIIARIETDDAQLRARLHTLPLAQLLDEACAVRDAAFGEIQSYSRKVFIPLTKLCRDYCHYCTFSRPLDRGEAAYLTPEEVLKIARDGVAAGCTEALFTLGDKPELRHESAVRALRDMGYGNTIEYLIDMCALVVRETGLLPHVNAGVMEDDEMAALRRVSVSQGLMLESTSERLCEKGGPHYRSPDKYPALRIANIAAAGRLAIPFTSGLLIGIGETREERLDALFVLRDLHLSHGHIQEVIVQNFQAKARTPMADVADPDREELLWTIAAARLILPPDIAIQAPPNLSGDEFAGLIDAGINDWGGISPVTPDHVNPEAAWPAIDRLREASADKGRVLAARLPVYPAYLNELDRWIDADMRAPLLRHMDADGLSRDDGWHAGDGSVSPPFPIKNVAPVSRGIGDVMDRIRSGEEPDEAMLVTLLRARGHDVERVCRNANGLRRDIIGPEVSYAVVRNINYTNICAYKCSFCAFSKGSTEDHLRGAPYDLDHEEIARRVIEAVERGASEVCLQGGIHPRYDGNTYLDILRTVKRAAPDVHVHAFSPLEVSHGAATLGLSVRDYLQRLKAEGLASLPGTAAEILDDEVRAIICPDKVDTGQWLNVVGTAHKIGLPTTATMMFGHVERPEHIARHIIAIRELQKRTGGFTEFVPLPFVHMEAPMALRGKSRAGPTFREVRLVHAIARLALSPHIRNIQTSWTKLGLRGAAICLNGGANDLGGTLMNESISRAAGSGHGQECPPETMETVIEAVGRISRPRTTLYADADPVMLDRAFGTEPLRPVYQTPAARRKIYARESNK